MTDDMRLTRPKRALRDQGIRRGLERAYLERLMGLLRRAHYDATLRKGKWVFTVTFDRVKDERRCVEALEVFRDEVSRTHTADCSWECQHKGTYQVTVSKR